MKGDKFGIEIMQRVKTIYYDQLNEKNLQNEVLSLTNALWKILGEPSINTSAELGNIYTGSLYAALLTLICDEKINLQNKRILLFSYGSGLASSMFLIKVKSNSTNLSSKVNLKSRLEDRIRIDPSVYDIIMNNKEKLFNTAPFTPEVSQQFLFDLINYLKVNEDLLYDGTYYLVKVDETYRRTYRRKGVSQTNTLLTLNKLSDKVIIRFLEIFIRLN